MVANAPASAHSADVARNPMMLRALLTIGAAQLATMLVLLVRTKTLALMLGPELVGIMAVIDKLLAVIVQTASFSMPYAAVRFLPERWSAGAGEYHGLFARMRNFLALVLVLAAIAALAVTATAPAFWGESLLPYQGVVAVALLGIPVAGLVPFLQNAVAGRLDQNRSMLVGFLHAVVLAMAIAGALWAGLAGYYAMYAVLGIVLVAIATRMATRGTAPPEGTPRFPVALPGALWRFSGALLVLAFLSPYAALFVHYRLLSVHGAQAAGWMQAAIGISLAVRAVIGSAHPVFLTPNVNRGGTPAERMEWTNNYQSTLALVAGLLVPPLLLFPGLVIEILYSSAFRPGAAFVVLFVMGEVVGLLSGTYQSLVVALDHMRAHVLNNLVAQGLVVAAAIALVEPLGILGAGLAFLAAPFFMFTATAVFLWRSHGLLVPSAVVVRTAWLLAMIAASGAMGVLYAGPFAEALLLKGALYAVTVAGFTAMLTGHERGRIREVVNGLRTRWT